MTASGAAGGRPPADFLNSVPLGTRVVARYRVPGGFTDALGYLRARDGRTCQVDTRRGLVAVPLADVVAAKRVPEPPPRRSGRTTDSAGPPGA
jgi:hypothetical protein